jgi:hypothetical protein
MGMGAGSDATRGHRLQELLLNRPKPAWQRIPRAVFSARFNPGRLGGIGQGR